MSDNAIKIPGIELLNQMSDLDDADKARDAFKLFCAKFGGCLLRYAGVWCEKWGISVSDGERGVDLTFERVLRHQSFDFTKYEESEMDMRIEIWLKRILHNVLYDIKAGRMSNLEVKDKSLEVIQDTESLYELWKTGNEDEDENMRIIYLTYMAYETQHQYLPQYLTKRLQEITGLSQPTIRVYKQRAKKYIQSH